MSFAPGEGMDFLVYHMLQRSASHTPGKEALVHGDERLTYADVARRVAGLAEGLRQAGVERGDRIGIHLDPSVPQVVSIFGVSRAGGVFVPLNSLLFPEQIAHIANDCRIRGLITSASKLAALAGVLDRLPSLEFLVVIGDAEPPTVLLARYD
ncbi:MAG: AMP-binding protein, partial [Candidatus Rokuibacteriota bacterium]